MPKSKSVGSDLDDSVATFDSRSFATDDKPFCNAPMQLLQKSDSVSPKQTQSPISVVSKIGRVLVTVCSRRRRQGEWSWGIHEHKAELF